MRRIARILIFTILLSCVSWTAFAEEEITPAAPIQGSEELLSTLGVVLPKEAPKGEYATRGEFFYLLVKAMNLDPTVKAYYMDFADVKLDDWRHGAAVIAVEKGLISPRKDQSLGVDEPLCPNFASDVLMRMLGFGFQGDLADMKRRFSSIYSDIREQGRPGTADMTSVEMKNMIYTALLSEYMEQAGFGKEKTYKVTDGKSFLEYAFQVKKLRGRLTGNQYTQIGGGHTPKGTIAINEGLYRSACGTLGEFIGYEGDFYIKSEDTTDTVICFNPNDENKETVIGNGELTEVTKSGSKAQLTYGTTSVKHINLPLTCDFIYNGEVSDFTLDKVKKLISEKSGELKIVQNTYGYVVCEKAYDVMIVESVSRLNKKISGKYGEMLEIPEENEYNAFSVTEQGTEKAFSDIKQNDIIMVLKGENSLEIHIENHAIVGMENGMKEDGIVIDDVYYKYSPYFNTVAAKQHTIHLGEETTFFFDSYGQLVDFDEDKIQHTGEYVFLVRTSMGQGNFDPDCKIRAVTMNAEMKEYTLEKKLYSDIDSPREKDKDVLQKIQGTRGIIYIECNGNGKICKLYPEGSKQVKLDAEEKKRKFKRGSGAFLVDTNDAHFPEFFTDNTTIALQVPISTAEEKEFDNIKNYKSIVLADELRDAENVTVQAYNFDDYTHPEIVLLRRENTVDYAGNTGLHLVTGFGETLQEDGNTAIAVYAYADGVETTVTLDSEKVMECQYQDEAGQTITRPMQKGDIVRFFYDNIGNAIASQWIRNIYTDFQISTTPDGVNNGNAYVIGTIEGMQGEFIKLKLADGSTMVFQKGGLLKNITVFDTEKDKASTGDFTDLVRGVLVLFRVYYTGVTDVILKK